MTMFFFFVVGSTVSLIVTLAMLRFLYRSEQVREGLAIQHLLVEQEIAKRDDELLVLLEDLAAPLLLGRHDLAHALLERRASLLGDRLATSVLIGDDEPARAELVVAEAELLHERLRDVRRVLVIARGADGDVV